MKSFSEIQKQLQQHERNILGHETASQSAVLVPLIQQNNEWHILFAVRSKHLKRQPREICFPGGRVDAADQSFQDTAIRESSEELQLPKRQIDILAPLDILVQSQYFYIY